MRERVQGGDWGVGAESRYARQYNRVQFTEST